LQQGPFFPEQRLKEGFLGRAQATAGSVPAHVYPSKARWPNLFTIFVRVMGGHFGSRYGLLASSCNACSTPARQASTPRASPNLMSRLHAVRLAGGGGTGGTGATSSEPRPGQSSGASQ